MHLLVRKEEVDAFYFYYTKAMNNAYDKMLDHFFFFIDVCMTDRNEVQFLQLIVTSNFP